MDPKAKLCIFSVFSIRRKMRACSLKASWSLAYFFSWRWIRSSKFACVEGAADELAADGSSVLLYEELGYGVYRLLWRLFWFFQRQWESWWTDSLEYLSSEASNGQAIAWHSHSPQRMRACVNLQSEFSHGLHKLKLKQYLLPSEALRRRNISSCGAQNTICKYERWVI